MLEGSDFDAKYTPAVRYFSQWARDYDGQKYYYKQGLLGYEFLEEVCGDDLENDIRMAHSALNYNLKRDYYYLVQGSAGPDIKYWDMSHKTWNKLSRYQRKILRK